MQPFLGRSGQVLDDVRATFKVKAQVWGIPRTRKKFVAHLRNTCSWDAAHSYGVSQTEPTSIRTALHRLDFELALGTEPGALQRPDGARVQGGGLYTP